jgi:YegS/Rv2252/BmrU family lipid kinase
MGKRVLLAVNTGARRGRGALERVAAALRSGGHEVIELPLDGSRDALSKAIVARRKEVDVVAAGGGDGTLLTAIDGLIETKLPLAVLPLGTFNELARTLGVPAELEAAAELVDRGVPVALDVGRANGVHYFNEASVGLSTRVTRLQTADLKRHLGILSVPVTTLRALRWARPMHLEIESEDGAKRRVRAVQLTVANSYRFGAVVENPEASLEDGQLWLYSIDSQGFWHTVRLLTAVALRRFAHTPEVMAVKGRRFMVRSVHEHRYGVDADSEEITRLPAEFSVVNRAVTVLVPPDRVPGIR